MSLFHYWSVPNAAWAIILSMLVEGSQVKHVGCNCLSADEACAVPYWEFFLMDNSGCAESGRRCRRSASAPNSWQLITVGWSRIIIGDGCSLPIRALSMRSEEDLRASRILGQDRRIPSWELCAAAIIGQCYKSHGSNAVDAGRLTGEADWLPGPLSCHARPVPSWELFLLDIRRCRKFNKAGAAARSGRSNLCLMFVGHSSAKALRSMPLSKFPAGNAASAMKNRRPGRSCARW